MSEFQKGVRELHAINQQGLNQFVALSGELESQAQVDAWVATESPKHTPAEGYTLYALDSTDPRFGKRMPAPTQPVADRPVGNSASVTPGTTQPNANAGANSLDGTEVVLTADANVPRKRNKAIELIPAEPIQDDGAIRDKQKEIWAARRKKQVEDAAAVKKHLASLKL